MGFLLSYSLASSFESVDPIYQHAIITEIRRVYGPVSVAVPTSPT